MVDSGADYCIFPGDAAADLNLTLEQGTKWEFKGTQGKTQLAYLHSVDLVVLLEEKHIFKVTTQIAFCADLEVAGGALLGQLGFFSNFKTTMYQRELAFDLEPLDGVASL